MERNIDLIRSILLVVEANHDPNELVSPRIDGFPEVEISHHIELMAEAGLITALDRSAIGVYFWSARQLTFAGHELLECVRDETLWNETRATVLAACGGIPMSVLQQALLERINRRVAAAMPDD